MLAVGRCFVTSDLGGDALDRVAWPDGAEYKLYERRRDLGQTGAVRLLRIGAYELYFTPLPAVGVVEAPKLGTLTIRLGVLTTSKIAGCPSLKTPVQVVFYQAQVGVFGTDHVIYQVTTADGKVDGYDVTINVKEATKLPVPNSEKPI